MFTNVFGMVFLLLAPMLLAARFVWKTPPWWVIVPVVVLVGWAAFFLMVISHFDDLQRLVASQETPDQDLMDRAFADGGPMMGAALGGWMFSIVYALPWWVVYLIAESIRKFAGRGPQARV